LPQYEETIESGCGHPYVTHVFPLTQHVGKPYVGGPGNCTQDMNPDPSYTFLDVGVEIPPTTFAAGTFAVE
jgi:hypothetical protein